jgi:ABC-2 type transport system ATP-binding protein
MDERPILIEADNVARRFQRCEALGGVSFAVARGQIAALLGPNGSGKTTTLRILATSLAPSAGRARVAGFDVETQSLEVRRRIGYLPESLPLYPEMRVEDYLDYRGSIKGLRGNLLATRLRGVVERCGLGDVAKRLVGTLSLGYRRRVGLADCWLTEPDVLLLDEPMAGLDAAQAMAMHDALREFGRHACVLFSTHDLAEAERLCDLAIVLNAGRLAAADAPAALAQRQETDQFLDAYLRLTAPPKRVQKPKARKSE